MSLHISVIGKQQQLYFRSLHE